MGQCQPLCRITLLLLALWLLTACATAPRTFKIGLAAPFEGLHRPLGYEALFAAKLAVQERNQAGGIEGYHIELVALNDFDAPAEAAIQARALTADPDVLGAVGHLSSAATAAALPVYRQAGLAVSIPWPVSESVFAANAGAVSVAATTEESATRLEQLMQQQGLKPGRPITDQSSAPPSSTPLYLAADGVTAAEIIVSRGQTTSPMFGQVDTGSPQLVQTAKAAANGFVFVSPGPNPADVEATGFIEAYQKLAGFPPGPRAALAYDATHILLDTIEQVMLSTKQLPTRAQIQTAITKTSRQGITGPITFATTGQRLKSPVWFYQIIAGQYPGELLFKEE